MYTHKPVSQAVLIFILVSGLFLFTNCSSSSNSSEENTGNTDKKNNVGLARASILKGNEAGSPALVLAKKAPASGWISTGELSIKKIDKVFQVVVTAETPLTRDKKYTFSYVYWKNGHKIAETTENQIMLKEYKRGDSIWADIKLLVDKKVISQTRSQALLIPNTIPLITRVDIPQMSGPGTYTITVNAEDFDEDTLSYSILPAEEGGTVPEFLSIDSSTGNISCTLGEKAPPEVVRFIVSVDDGNEGVSQKTVTIPFKIYTKKEEKKEEPPVEPEKQY